MGTSYREQLGDNRPYWKVIVSLAFSLVGTILFVWIGLELLAYFMPFVSSWFWQRWSCCSTGRGAGCSGR